MLKLLFIFFMSYISYFYNFDSMQILTESGLNWPNSFFIYLDSVKYIISKIEWIKLNKLAYWTRFFEPYNITHFWSFIWLINEIIVCIILAGMDKWEAAFTFSHGDEDWKWGKTRYSAGLFSIRKGGYIIKTPEELVDEEYPLIFKPFDRVEFLKFYYTEEGYKVPSALRAYCGASWPV